jgi:hypothetical protein
VYSGNYTPEMECNKVINAGNSFRHESYPKLEDLPVWVVRLNPDSCDIGPRTSQDDKIKCFVETIWERLTERDISRWHPTKVNVSYLYYHSSATYQVEAVKADIEFQTRTPVPEGN